MPVTNQFGFPYESPLDRPGITLTGGPSGTKAILAEEVETVLLSQIASLQAQINELQSSPPTKQGEEVAAAFEITNTSFGVDGQPGNVGTTFTAPKSARVLILWNSLLDIDAATNANIYISPVVRTGTTIGSGISVLPASDDRAVRISRSIIGINDGGARPQMGSSYLLSGLVADSSYNIRLEHRVTSQTGEVRRRNVIVAPAT